jgi:hypothetical protein
MRATALAGIVLIVLGVMALSYSGISYTTRDKKIDIGPIKVTEEKQHTMPIPPVLGGVALAGGIGLLIFGKR